MDPYVPEILSGIGILMFILLMKFLSSARYAMDASRRRLGKHRVADRTGKLLVVFMGLMIWHAPAYALVQRNFLNNGFESPFGLAVPTSFVNYCQVGQNLVSPWVSDDTTGPNGNCNAYGGPGSGNIIELWFNGFNSGGSVWARAGKTHAELNAESAGTLHQTICMLQNEDVTWALSHRARQDGTMAPIGDEMKFFVGDIAAGLVLDATTTTAGATTVNSCQSGSNISTVTPCSKSTFTTAGSTKWGDYSGVFKWTGLTANKNIEFSAIKTGSGSLTVGNFIDEVYFYLKPVIEFSANNGSGLESVAAPASPRLRVVGTLNAPLPVSITVTGGTATLGTDYTTPSGTNTFTTTIPAGVYFGTESVATGIQIINDRLSETDETLVMQVDTANPYIISSTITCGNSASNPATYTILDDDAFLKLTKTTQGTVGAGTFNFNMTNVDTDLTTSANETTATLSTGALNTTVTFDADSSVAGIQAITGQANGTDVTINESAPGWRSSGSCSVSGGTNPTGSAINISAGGAVTIPATNVTVGATINCDYVNTRTATLIINKTSVGGIGSFVFTPTNVVDADVVTPGVQTTATVTTTAAGSAKTYDADSATAGNQAMTVSATGTDVVVTETVPPGWALSSGSCMVTGGGSGTFSLSGSAVTIPGANVTAGSVITCNFTNSKTSATLTVMKVSNGDVGTFSFTTTNTNPIATNVLLSTSATNTPTTTSSVGAGLNSIVVASNSTNITIAEAAPPLGFTASSGGCVNRANSNVTVTSSFVSGSRTITINSGNIPALGDIVCTMINNKSSDHGDAPASYGDASNSIQTMYLGTTVPDDDNGNFATWQGQTTANGDETNNTADEGVAQLLSGSPGSFPLLASNAAIYSLNLVCRGSSTANAVNGWIDFDKNGVFDNSERASGTCSSNSSTAGTVGLVWRSNPTGSEGTIPATLVAGNTYVRFRFANVASTSATGAGTNGGEVEDYVIPITAQAPKLALVKTIGSRFAGTDQFTITIKEGATTRVTATTSGTDTSVTTTTYTATAGVVYTFSEVGAGTPAANLANYVSTYSCSNAYAGGTVIASGTGTSFTVTPAANDDITCTFSNTKNTVIDYDVGDAPSGGTVVDTVARNYGGASHLKPTTPSIYLGTTPPDIDSAANQTAWQALTTASGDDTGGTADEGIVQLLVSSLNTFPVLTGTATSYSLTLRCAGTTTANAVSGWIDFNKNGVFTDAGERAQGTCSSSGAGTVTLNWSGLTGLTAGSTFARFRIAGNAAESASVTGAAADGEVEDYPFTISTAGYTISGKVFKDSGTSAGTANNGIRDGAETGIANVTVKLTDCAVSPTVPVIYSTTTTDGSGDYSLSVGTAPVGNVCVEQSNLSSYTSTGASIVNTPLPNTVPTSVSGTSYTYNRTSDRISFILVASTSYTGLNFGDVPANRFITDGAKTGIAGSTLIYPHTFIAGTGGLVTFSLPGATASPVIPDWKEVLYIDTDCNAVLDGSESASILLPVAMTVVEGQTICLIQKEFIPAGAPQGASNHVPVQALFAYTGSTVPNATYTRQDITTVSSNALFLMKEVRNVTTPTSPVWKTSNTAKSGETLEYRITYTNNGAETIKNLQINDATPSFTTFVSGLCETAVAATPASLGLCTLTKTLTPNNTGGLKWNFTPTLAAPVSQLQPGGSGFVTYRVKVD